MRDACRWTYLSHEIAGPPRCRADIGIQWRHWRLNFWRRLGKDAPPLWSQARTSAVVPMRDKCEPRFVRCNKNTTAGSDSMVRVVGYLGILSACFVISWPDGVSAQAWRNCIPNSIGPGGCDSIGPGGGRSIGPGGGESIGPSGGLSIGPSGGQSIGPGGGQSIGPGGGQSMNRDRTQGLDTNTMRPYPCGAGGRC